MTEQEEEEAGGKFQEEEQEDAWGACWLDDLEINATMTCTELLWGERVLVDNKSETHAHVPELAIDSGAASNVAGMNWVLSWRKWGNAQEALRLKESTREFLFGSGVIHPSAGTIELKGWIWVLPPIG